MSFWRLAREVSKRLCIDLSNADQACRRQWQQLTGWEASVRCTPWICTRASCCLGCGNRERDLVTQMNIDCVLFYELFLQLLSSGVQLQAHSLLPLSWSTGIWEGFVLKKNGCTRCCRLSTFAEKCLSHLLFRMLASEERAWKAKDTSVAKKVTVRSPSKRQALPSQGPASGQADPHGLCSGKPWARQALLLLQSSSRFPGGRGRGEAVLGFAMASPPSWIQRKEGMGGQKQWKPLLSFFLLLLTSVTFSSICRTKSFHRHLSVVQRFAQKVVI